MPKAPAFQMYPMDFDMDTATWENEEVGAYLRLLFYEWINGSLPNDTYKLAKIVRENTRKFKRKWEIISIKFIQNGNGQLINRKLEEIREKQAQYIESQREKGLRSAKKRWAGHITPVITMVTDRLQPNDNSSSSSSLKKEIYKERKIPIPDDEWIKEIQKKTCYQHINVLMELEKCLAWFKEKNIIVSRKRFLNWLNRNQFQTKPIDIKTDPYSNLEYVKSKGA